MNTALNMVQALSLGVIGVLALVGVLHRRYNDTLLQRVALSALSMGCAAAIVVHCSGVNPDHAITWVLASVALYFVGILIKRSK